MCWDELAVAYIVNGCKLGADIKCYMLQSKNVSRSFEVMLITFYCAATWLSHRIYRYVEPGEH